MKKSTKAFLAVVMQKLEPFGPITARAMFGGYGVYYDRMIFACIVADELYFRIDDSSRADFEKYDSKPFVYSGSGRSVTMPYMTLPEKIWQDPKLLLWWIERARMASIRAKKSK